MDSRYPPWEAIWQRGERPRPARRRRDRLPAHEVQGDPALELSIGPAARGRSGQEKNRTDSAGSGTPRARSQPHT